MLEPFISPALYEPYMNNSNPAVDEWTLCENIAADASSGGVAKVIEDHYKTFVVCVCAYLSTGVSHGHCIRPKRTLLRSLVLG